MMVQMNVGQHVGMVCESLKHGCHLQDFHYEDFLELPICFLPFIIALVHAAFTAPSFGNLCMMISPSTLLCFLYAALSISCHCHIYQ